MSKRVLESDGMFGGGEEEREEEEMRRDEEVQSHWTMGLI
jgi:hypothetical protein